MMSEVYVSERKVREECCAMNFQGIDVVESALIGVGLNEAEAAVYKTSLALGPRPASYIAKRAGLNRTHVYDVLAGLASKGVVREFIKNSVKHFSSCPPKELVELIERRESKLNEQKQQLLSALPAIEQLVNSSSRPPAIKYLQGFSAIAKVLDETLEVSSGVIHGFADVQSSTTLSKVWSGEYTRERIGKGIWYYGIVNEETACALDGEGSKRECLELKVLPSLSLPVEIIIVDSKVVILSACEERVGMVVENEGVAAALLNLHRVLWAGLARGLLGNSRLDRQL